MFATDQLPASLARISTNHEAPAQVGPRYINQDVIRRAERAHKIQVRTVRTVSAMAQLRDEWRDLERFAATDISGFQSFDWCYAWAATHCDRTGIKPHIVIVHHGPDLMLVWPMMMTCIGPFCILRWMTDPFGQYGDVIAVDNEHTSEYLNMAWQEICTSSDAALVRLRHVRRDALIHDLLESKCELAEQPDIAPYLDLSVYPDAEAYDARYNRSQRKRRRKILKEFEELGALEFIEHDGPGHLNGLIDRILAQKIQWLRNRGSYSEALTSEHFADFLKALTRIEDPTLRLVTTVFTAGDREVSYEVGLRYKDRHMCFITAHNSELTAMSPGRIHMHQTQHQALSDGMRTFDLMVPGDPYKQSWSSGSVEVVDFHAALNTRGRIFTEGFLKTARPAMRRLYHATPANLRRHLTPLLSPANNR
jgi:CelD/BcsL family acetyltransferase involved in cellulose biosynthesis